MTIGDDRTRTDAGAVAGSVAPATLAGRVDAVVVGTSAGGVEALLAILPSLPAQLAVPVIVVVHLPRQRPSLLAPLFASRCAVAVREVEDKMPIEPGVVYFAPPDYHVLVDRGPCLALSTDEPVNFSRPSIDVLFETAIDVYGRRLAAVVLTGANEDGSAGFAAVHRSGGVTIVQDPDTASVAAMPASAAGRVEADHVLPLDGIAALLGTLDRSVNAT